MFTKNKDGASAQSYVPPADASKSAASRTGARSTGVASIICNDMEIKGSINSEGALHIDGVVDGDVTAGDITIGATGKVIGEVKGEAVKVKGEVLGSIRGRRVELETGARVEGDILHASLSIQPNAIFEGQVKHAEDPLKTSAPKAARPASGDAASSAAKPAATDNKSASTSASSAHGSALS
ncbi:polymer-forming cytoskeletal protein [Henriciella barbarensis]|uniref:Polymer-forming cytoskeletal protein n=1 Tax=Henriciella barbarensis TaxID=86342 RepID=A0A399QSY2_9PROT|nr:polymer-forming cytoskeletal protein [Henriciella barbarensis]RIJ20637.1 polymer-forming cytoskeletal protein [Henriciella barbarensis]